MLSSLFALRTRDGFCILQGRYCYTSEFWSELSRPGETYTSLSELHFAGDSHDQVRSELERPARWDLLFISQSRNGQWNKSEAERATGEGVSKRYSLGGPQKFSTSPLPPGWMVLFLSGGREIARKFGFESANTTN